MISRFRGYLARGLAEPNEASGQVLEYLEIKGIPSLYLRGGREAGREVDWYTQLSFSGCAGMAEVSALVAAHWAAKWAQQELPALDREVFAPFGFIPAPGQTLGWGDRFLPVAPLGYLRYVPADERVADASARHAGLMADGPCRCQLCAPDFEPLS